jgi:hypothetical protein
MSQYSTHITVLTSYQYSVDTYLDMHIFKESLKLDYLELIFIAVLHFIVTRIFTNEHVP